MVPPRPRQLTWEPSLCPPGQLVPPPALWTLLWDAGERAWRDLGASREGIWQSTWRAGEMKRVLLQGPPDPLPAPRAHTQCEVIAWIWEADSQLPSRSDSSKLSSRGPEMK